MTDSPRLQSAVVWVAAGQVISVIVALGTMKVWATYLQPAQLGLMALIIGVASILVGIFAAPLLQAIFVSYPEYRLQNNGADFRHVSSVILKKRALRMITLILFLGVPLTLLWNLHWSTPLVVAGLFFVDVYRLFERNMYAAARHLRAVTAITVGDLIFRLCFVWLNLHLFGSFAYIAIIGNLAGAILFVVILKTVFSLEAYSCPHSTDAAFKVKLRKKIIQLARPLMPSMILANVTEMGSRYFIGATIGLEAAGLYVVSYGFVKRPYGMLNHVGEMTMTPLVKAAITEKNTTRTARARWYWLLFITGFSLLGAGLFYLFRELLVETFLSVQYMDAASLLSGLAIAITLYNIANVFGYFSMTLENSRAVFVNNLIGSMTTVGLTIVLCLKYGITGAVWALIAGYGLQLLTSLITFRQSLRRHA